MRAAIRVSTSERLRCASQGAIDGVEIDQQIGQVIEVLLLIAQRLHILHRNFRRRVNGRILRAFQSVDGFTQPGGYRFSRVVERLVTLDSRLYDGILRHQGNFAFQRAVKEGSSSHQPVDLVGAFKDALDTSVAVGFLDGVLLHEAVATEDLHALVYGIRERLAAVNFGDGCFDGVLFDSSENSFGIAARALPRLLDIGGGAEDFAFGGVGFGGHTRQLLLNQTEFVQVFAKGFALNRIRCGQVQCAPRPPDRASAQFQAPNVENVEGDLVAFVNLAEQVLDWNLHIFKVDLPRRGAFDSHLALFRAGGDARPVGFYDEGRGLLAADTSKGDHDVGKASVGDPLLRAVEDVVRAIG